MYLTELLQKPILSLYEGEILGNIHKVYFDKQKNKIKHFEIINEEEISYCLQPKHIYTVGKHAITIKNKQNLILSLNEQSSTILPINVKVYSLQGEYLGIVSDYSITDKYEIDNLMLDNQNLIKIADIASCSSNSIVVYYSNDRVNIKNFRYRIQNKPKTSSKVKVLPTMFSSFNKILPSPSSTKNNFIVGRICTQDIYDNNKNLIIKQNSTITEQVLAIASSKNKLQELMKFSKIK